MVRGITTSTAGMLVDERIQQVLSNNLANSQTTGFKASFAEQLAYPMQHIQEGNYAGGLPSKNLGMMGTGVLFQESVPLFSQGQPQSTGRSLDLAIQDTAPAGTYAAVLQPGAGAAAAAGGTGTPATGYSVASGLIAVGQGGRLEQNGQPLAVLDAAGNAVPNLYAVHNPAYKGTNYLGADGKPVTDAGGQLSYWFADGQGKIVGSAADYNEQGVSLLVGNASTVAPHSFFPVSVTTQDGQTGLALTRDGHLSADAKGILRDSAGNPILPIGANGLPIAGARIQLNRQFQGQTVFNQDGSAAIDNTGQPSYRAVGANGTVIAGAHMGTVNANPAQLQPLGQSEFQVNGGLTSAGAIAVLQPGTATLAVGQLEQSNVDVTATMVQMMAVMQNYDANQHAMQMADAEVSRAVSDVGKVNI